MLLADVDGLGPMPGNQPAGNRGEPKVWVLLGKGAGGNAQMIALAKALGLPFEAKQLYYNRLNRLPNLLLGASGITLDRGRSDSLLPPWPDLVIAASRRSAPIARWIKRESSGRTRLVHLMHTQAPLKHFDLVITMPQYRLPRRDNVLCLTGALNRATSMEAASSDWKHSFQHLPRPWIALIAGGNSSTYAFEPSVAEQLAKAANAQAQAEGGSLLVSTTPRTPTAAADALFGAVDVPAFKYRWRPNDEQNPYQGYLALADRFIVTVDSASLAMEACSTGKPVQVFEWEPRRRSLEWLSPVLHSARVQTLYEAAIGMGLFKPSRDFEAYHRSLRECGLTSRLGESSNAPPRAALTDFDDAVARIHAVLETA